MSRLKLSISDTPDPELRIITARLGTSLDRDESGELALDAGGDVGRGHLQVIRGDGGEGADHGLSLLCSVRHRDRLLEGVRVRLEGHVERAALARFQRLLKVSDEAERELVRRVDVDDIHTVEIGCRPHLRVLDVHVCTGQRLPVLVRDGTGDTPLTVVLRIYAADTCRYEQRNEHQKSIQSFH